MKFFLVYLTLFFNIIHFVSCKDEEQKPSTASLNDNSSSASPTDSEAQEAPESQNEGETETVNYTLKDCSQLESEGHIQQLVNCYDNYTSTIPLLLTHYKTFTHQDNISGSNMCGDHYLVASSVTDSSGTVYSNQIMAESSLGHLSEGKFKYIFYYYSRDIAWYKNSIENTDVHNYEYKCTLYVTEDIATGELEYYPYDPFDTSAITDSSATKASDAFSVSNECYFQPHPGEESTWRDNGEGFLPLKNPVGHFSDWVSENGGNFTWIDVVLGFNSYVHSDIWSGIDDAENISFCADSDLSALASQGANYGSFQVPVSQLIMNHIVKKYIQKIRIAPEDLFIQE